ncbi:Sphingomyelin phosphodiesterase 3 [Entomortierella beljakovae]|nr:Sphingomyelin phosphodiesterase 3 [Entomortierella beljakovae]
MKITSILPLALATIAAVPSFTSAANVTLSVLSNNVYFLSEVLYPNWGQRTRAQHIAASNYVKYHDVIIIQECFDSDPCAILRDGLRSQYPYQTPTVGQTKNGWDSTSGSYSNLTPENGGVVIVSKWPILQQRQYIFKNACGADWWSNKGYAYVAINYQGSNVHVFGTHMQSDDSRCSAGEAASCRSSELGAWKSYVDSLNIPSNELVIYGGDFNIKRDTPEYSSLLTKLNVNQASSFGGHAWTWDTVTNEIAKYNYPNLIPEYLDYIFTDKSHKAVDSFTQTALNVKAPEYILQSVAYHEYSDHYPVQGVIGVTL